ncbi:MAG TPA: hypothetical protein V6D19_07180 [Stenomitos sp.]
MNIPNWLQYILLKLLSLFPDGSLNWSDEEYERFHQEYCSEIAKDLETRYGDK